MDKQIIGIPLMGPELSREVLKAEKDQASVGRYLIVGQSNYTKSDVLSKIMDGNTIGIESLDSIYEIVSREGNNIRIKSRTGSDNNIDLSKYALLVVPRTKIEAEKLLDAKRKSLESLVIVSEPYVTSQEKTVNPIAMLVQTFKNLIRASEDSECDNIILQALVRS